MTFADDPSHPRIGEWQWRRRRRRVRLHLELTPPWAAAWAMVAVVAVAAGVVLFAALVQGVAEVVHGFCQMGVGFFQCTPPGAGARLVLRIAPIALVAVPFAVAHRSRHEPWLLWGGAGLAAGLAVALGWWQATGNLLPAVVLGLAGAWLVSAAAEILAVFPLRVAAGAVLTAVAAVLAPRSAWVVVVPFAVGPTMALVDTLASRLTGDEHR